MSNLIIAKNTTSAGTDNIMQTSVTFLRAFTMCGTISPFYCCDNSFIKNFVNVYCPNTMCLSIFFLTKVSQSLERSDYQCPQFKSTCRVRNFPCEEQISSFCWRLTEWFTFVNRCKPQVNMFLEICFVQHVQTENVHPLFWRKISANHNQAYTSSCPKRQKKTIPFGQNRVDFLLVATVIRKLRSSLNLYTFNLQSGKMTFSVSNNAIESSPDFGPHSVILTVINTCPTNDNRFPRTLYWQPGAWFCLRDKSFSTIIGLQSQSLSNSKEHTIWRTWDKVSLFAHYCKKIFEHPNRQIRLSFRFRNSKFYGFSIKAWVTL